jgi:lipoprotein-releasing system permease protein
VARTFETGFSEFDRSWAVVAPETLAGLPGGGAPSYEVAVADARRAPEIAETIRAGIGPEALIADWTQLNRELFAALALQQRALFLLLGLIVVVATFNVASTLVVLVRERRRDLGVLAALGLPPAEIRQVFLLYGLALGALGTGLGLALAAAVAWVVDRFQLLSFGPEVAEIYFLSSVPMRLALRDVVAIALLSIGVTTLACWLPARRAGRIEPATALQYE